MHSFSAIIKAWPSLNEFKDDMAVPLTTAQSWRDRDSIPSPHWKRLIERARARRIRGVTYAVLGELEPGKQAKEREQSAAVETAGARGAA